MNEYDSYVVIDVEATCCDDGSIPRGETEIIEVGAVRVDRGTLEVLGELDVFVRPVLHRTLTRFCTELTTITQAEVDAGVSFAEAVRRLEPWFRGGRALFCSWGEYDRNQFDRDARRSKVRLPWRRGDHWNLKQEFSDRGGYDRLYGNRQAMAVVGLTPTGVHHRGLDDARNIARLLPWCVGPAAR